MLPARPLSPRSSDWRNSRLRKTLASVNASKRRNASAARPSSVQPRKRLLARRLSARSARKSNAPAKKRPLAKHVNAKRKPGRSARLASVRRRRRSAARRRRRSASPKSAPKRTAPPRRPATRPRRTGRPRLRRSDRRSSVARSLLVASVMPLSRRRFSLLSRLLARRPLPTRRRPRRVPRLLAKRLLPPLFALLSLARLARPLQRQQGRATGLRPLGSFRRRLLLALAVALQSAVLPRLRRGLSTLCPAASPCR